MESSQRNSVATRRFIVGLVFLIFFVISFLTNILGPLVPDILNSFHVSLTLAAVLPFCFFIAYGVMSIPAGFLVERWGEKRLLVAAFLAGTGGALSFAVFPAYHVATISLFVMGAGMAALQVAINPLLRVAGGEANFAYNSAFAQLVFGAASFVSPLVYSYLVNHLSPGGDHMAVGAVARSSVFRALVAVTPPSMPWVSIYWLFAVATAAMAALIAALRLPAVDRNADESAGTLAMYALLLRNPTTWLYFISVVAYVGSEQGTADWMSEFLSRYHRFDPHVTGAAAVSYFWGLLTIGCLGGMILLKLQDSRRVLIGFSLGALLSLSVALFGSAQLALFAFPCIGLFASIMWPTIASLALNSIPAYHGPFTGILCTGIMGGAIVPLLIGQVGDRYGLRVGMLLLYLTFGWILSVGFWAKPLISNALIRKRVRKKSVRPVASTGLAVAALMLCCASALPAQPIPVEYLKLPVPATIRWPEQAWEGDQQPHTLSVVEVNRGGYRYWGWYGLNHGRGIGLARSNDLLHWTKFEGNPLWLDARWPSVLKSMDPKEPGTLYFAVTRGYDGPSSRIVLASSRDGQHLSELKTLVSAVAQQRNQNPNLFWDPVTRKYFLTFYRGNDTDYFDIVSRSASSVQELDRAPETVLIHSTETLAAPTLLYVPRGIQSRGPLYYLATEIYPNRYERSKEGDWQVRVYYSHTASGPFVPVAGNSVQKGDRACLFQHVFDATYYGYQSHLDRLTDRWEMEVLAVPLPR
jgi:FHS family L-fucose permease-like MFS transporter